MFVEKLQIASTTPLMIKQFNSNAIDEATERYQLVWHQQLHLTCDEHDTRF